MKRRNQFQRRLFLRRSCKLLSIRETQSHAIMKKKLAVEPRQFLQKKTRTRNMVEGPQKKELNESLHLAKPATNFSYKYEEVTHTLGLEDSVDVYKRLDRRASPLNFLQGPKRFSNSKDKRSDFLSDLDRVKVKVLVVSPQASLNTTLLPSIGSRVTPHNKFSTAFEQNMSALQENPKISIDFGRTRHYRPMLTNPPRHHRPKLSTDGYLSVGFPLSSNSLHFQSLLLINPSRLAILTTLSAFGHLFSALDALKTKKTFEHHIARH